MIRFFQKYIYCIGIPSLVFFIIPLFLVKQLENEYLNIDIKLLFILSLIILLISICFLLIVTKLFEKIGHKEIFYNFTGFIFYFILIAGLYIPVIQSTGMVDPENIPTNKINFIVVVSIALTIVVLSMLKMKKIIIFGVFTILVINIILSFYSLYFVKEKNERIIEKNWYIEVSNKKNILVISFDGIHRDIAIEQINKNPDFKNYFKDFIIYENVISSSPATQASIYGELYGNQDFKTTAETQDELVKLAPDLLFTNYLDSRGYKVHTFGPYKSGFLNEERKIHATELYTNNKIANNIINIIKFYDYIFVRIGTRHTVNFMKKTYKLTKLFKRVESISDNFENKDLLSLAYKVSNSHGPEWDKKNKLMKTAYEGYLKKIGISNADKVAHFMHFTHTHFPVDFDSECELHSDNEDWFNSHQNRKGVEDETVCALSQMAEFIKRIKEIGVYDQSLIIFKSDHGKPASYLNPNSIESKKIREHQYWGYGRYTPILFIKNFGAEADSIKYDDNAVMIDDLAKTLCIHSGVGENCSVYPGFDLLDEELTIPETADSFIFIVKSKESDYKFDTHETLHLKRKKDFFNNIDTVLNKK